MMILLSGYQGPSSVHTEGLRHLASRLGPSGIEVEVVADVTAGGVSAKSLFQDIETNDAHVCYMASSYLTARVASLAVLDLPLSVSDRQQAHAALDGRAGEILVNDIAAATDIHVLGFWDNGVRHISNRLRPLRGPDDCIGLTIRTLDNQIYQDTLQAFGFRPVVTDVRELANAIATRAVDAQDNPLTNLLNFDIHKHHRFLSLVGYMFGIALLVCRRSWFMGLPPEVSEAISGAVRAATLHQRSAAIEQDELVLKQLDQCGVQVLGQYDLDMDGFRAAAAPVFSSTIATLDPRLVGAYIGPGHAA
jgi:TRAP-type C4-dicarboxylate transport system substrate-binding protein